MNPPKPRRNPTAGPARISNSAGCEHEEELILDQKREDHPQTEHALLCQQKGEQRAARYARRTGSRRGAGIPRG